MPPKPKLHKSTGKSAKELQSQGPPSVQLDPEVEQNIELELCWCIQQLQVSLNSGKLNQKQVQDTTKTLNTLMSNTAPLVKKRQAMRLTFGDYRAKMAKEDQKLSKAFKNIKIMPASPSNKSVFVKKSNSSDPARNSFRFNFDVPECDQSGPDDEVPVVDHKENISIKQDNANFKFNVSDNAFRFNFTSN